MCDKCNFTLYNDRIEYSRYGKQISLQASNVQVLQSDPSAPLLEDQEYEDQDDDCKAVPLMIATSSKGTRGKCVEKKRKTDSLLRLRGGRSGTQEPKRIKSKYRK